MIEIIGGRCHAGYTEYNIYHRGAIINEIKLTTPDEVDAELIGWLQAAYALG